VSRHTTGRLTRCENEMITSPDIHDTLLTSRSISACSHKDATRESNRKITACLYRVI